MSSFWHWAVIIIVAVHLVAYLWLLFATSNKKVPKNEENTTGHEWDGIKELDTPMPRWWLWLFVGTIIFSIGYLYAYPGMGNYEGSLKWTQINQFEANHKKVTEARNASFATFIDKPIDEMIEDRKAMLIGSRIFANNCALCHGSDAQGATGFPNLADDDWNWGGEFEQILTSVSSGRQGIMPPFAPALGDDGVKQVAAYVRSMSESGQDPALVAEGQNKFTMFCAACHGGDGKGNALFGAPDLTDDIWLHGSSEVIETALYEGLSGNMPAHATILDENRVKLVSAYVYSLNKK